MDNYIFITDQLIPLTLQHYIEQQYSDKYQSKKQETSASAHQLKIKHKSKIIANNVIMKIKDFWPQKPKQQVFI